VEKPIRSTAPVCQRLAIFLGKAAISLAYCGVTDLQVLHMPFPGYLESKRKPEPILYWKQAPSDRAVRSDGSVETKEITSISIQIDLPK
jgi:hypothetical protein